jgi:hypothetical protein
LGFRVERRLSVLVAVAGLVAALGIFLLGRKTAAPDDLRTAAADLDSLIRETTAGAQARADTLAQLPRLGWAVATDESTMRDLTTEELAFRPHPGEQIEITQMRRGGGEPRRLLHIPADNETPLPVLPGTHTIVQGDRVSVVTVVSVEPRQRADELLGILAVAKQVDTSSIERTLSARGISAELRTSQGSVTLAGKPIGAAAVEKIPLTGPAAQGAQLVAASVVHSRWPRIVAPIVLLLAFGGAVLLWRRGSPRQPAFPLAGLPAPLAKPTPSVGVSPLSPPAPKPTPSVGLPPLPPSPKPTPSVGLPPLPPSPKPTPSVGLPPLPPSPKPTVGLPPPSTRRSPPVGLPRPFPIKTPVVGVPSESDPTPAAQGSGPVPSGTTPAVGVQVPDDAAVPQFMRRERALTGRVDISLGRSGSVPLSPRVPGQPSPPDDPRTEEYRSLFSEFVKLRRTTGETVDGLDAEHFVATLRHKRAELMKRLSAKDVRFKLAFQNGKAAIRYVTVT